MGNKSTGQFFHGDSVANPKGLIFSLVRHTFQWVHFRTDSTNKYIYALYMDWLITIVDLDIHLLVQVLPTQERTVLRWSPRKKSKNTCLSVSHV